MWSIPKMNISQFPWPVLPPKDKIWVVSLTGGMIIETGVTVSLAEGRILIQDPVIVSSSLHQLARCPPHKRVVPCCMRLK